MSMRRRFAAFSFATLLLAATTSDSATGLKMEVTPTISRAPAVVTVRIMLEPRADDRTLYVVAESASFYRASEVDLDGERSEPMNLFEFRGLPTGMYHLTAFVRDSHGTRATAWRIARVEPGFGSN